MLKSNRAVLPFMSLLLLSSLFISALTTNVEAHAEDSFASLENSSVVATSIFGSSPEPGFRLLTSRKVNKVTTINANLVQSNEVLLNPDKGWVLYGMPSDHSATTKAYGSVGYLRFDWRDIEPQDGVFNWAVIDNAVQAWANEGKKAAFGVMSANTSSTDPYVTPKWVFDEGAKAQNYTLTDPNLGVPGAKIIPVWNDPIFEQKVQGLITALATRYDGDSRIAFVDTRSYGNWGEGHNYPYYGVELTQAELQQQLQWYRSAFSKTQIIVPWGEVQYDSVYDWAVNNGMGLRRDGILDPWPAAPLSDTVNRAIGKAPVVFEFVNSYTNMVQNGTWSAQTLTQNINSSLPSYVSLGMWGNDSEAFVNDNLAMVQQYANKLGYNFTIQQAQFSASRGIGVSDNLQITWLNNGLTPRYQGTRVALALLNQNNQVQAKVWLPSQPRDWQPGTPLTENLAYSFGNQPSGTYRLAVGLFSDNASANPDIKLGLMNHTADNWYILG